MQILNSKIEQLKTYSRWEAKTFPDDQERMKILDWAISEIEWLRLEVQRLNRVATL